LTDFDVHRNTILKWNLEMFIVNLETEFNSSGSGQMTIFSEHGKVISDSMGARNFLTSWRNINFLRRISYYSFSRITS
jgi:hypothetical protein